MASLTDPPKEGQAIVHENKEYTTVKEGLAYVLVPKNARTSVDPRWKKRKADDDGPESQSVFYNPIQQFNRDLSVLAIRAYGEHVMAWRMVEHERRVKKNAGKDHRKRAKRKAENVSENEQDTDNKSANGIKRVKTGDKRPASMVQNGSVEHTGDDEGAESIHQEVLNTEETVATGNPNGQELASNDDHEQPATNPTEAAHTETTGEVEEQQPVQPVMGNIGAVETGKVLPITSEQNTVLPENADMKRPQDKWRPKFRILDALSATGLRALRYAKEIPFVTSVTANDLSPSATASIKTNVKHNGLVERIKVTTSNALAHMYGVVCRQAADVTTEHVGKYDVIDLDPYGTAAPFFDAALQALHDGGLLCVTCTDAGVFASTGYPEKTYSLYGGLPSKGPQCHEVGLRLIVHAIASTAARYGIAIEPLLSLSIDFYARVFVRVRKSAAEVKFLAGKTMMVYNCDAGCGAWTTQFLARNSPQHGKKGGFAYKHSLAQAPTAASKCEHCGFKTHLSGPMWGGPLHNPAFIDRILSYFPDEDLGAYATKDRIIGMLSMAREETLQDSLPSATDDTKETPQNDDNPALIPAMDPAEIDHHPFFFNPSALAKVIHCQAPSEAQIRGALRHSGFRATRSHTKPGSIRTDAPWSAIWEIMREWVRQKAPVREGAIKPGTAGWGIMGLDRSRKEQQGGKLGDTGDRDQSRAPENAGEHCDNPTSKAMKEVAEDVEAAPAQKETLKGEAKKLEVVFDEKLGKDPDKKKLVRFQLNPRANWGPMTRAKGHG